MKKKLTSKQLWGKKQIFLIQAEPYLQEIIVVVNGQARDVIPFLKKFKTPRADDIVKHMENDKDYMEHEHKLHDGSAETWTELPHGYLLTCSHQKDWRDTVCVISHECLHLTHYILRNAGVVLSKESEEAYTYLQAHLLRQILDKIY